MIKGFSLEYGSHLLLSYSFTTAVSLKLPIFKRKIIFFVVVGFSETLQLLFNKLRMNKSIFEVLFVNRHTKKDTLCKFKDVC